MIGPAGARALAQSGLRSPAAKFERTFGQRPSARGALPGLCGVADGGVGEGAGREPHASECPLDAGGCLRAQPCLPEGGMGGRVVYHVA
jgi:hypothetical protein